MDKIQPPVIRPPMHSTWPDYLWPGLAVAVAIATVVGFAWMASRPLVH